jgi:osmoprotectant transport system permease protein
MTGSQRFWQVELPLGLPLVVSGLRLALVQVWATATIAALVAGPGLGQIITDGFFRSNYGKGIAGALVVAAVALVLELIAALLQRSVDPTRRSTRASTPSGGHTDALSVTGATVEPSVESVG